jgi:lipopolysaccharide export system permease protein
MELFQSDDPSDQAELQWRLGVPLSAALLALLAVPLSRGQPREPRYGKALVAILAYIIYTNVLAIGRGWVADGTIPTNVGLWWIHLGALLIGLVMLKRSERLRPGT